MLDAFNWVNLIQKGNQILRIYHVIHWYVSLGKMRSNLGHPQLSSGGVMSIWSSIIDLLLFLSRYLINSIMIKFIHNQGHIKTIIINEPPYDTPWLRHCISISVLSITILCILHIITSFFVWLLATPHTCTCIPHNLAVTCETRICSTFSRIAYEINPHPETIPCLKPVDITRLKGIHPQLVTSHYGTFTHPTINKDFLAN